jgi:hypothetical protein
MKDIEYEVRYAPANIRWKSIFFRAFLYNHRGSGFSIKTLLVKCGGKYANMYRIMDGSPVQFGFLSENYSPVSLRELYMCQIRHGHSFYRIWDILECKKPKILIKKGVRVVTVFSAVLGTEFVFLG